MKKITAIMMIMALLLAGGCSAPKPQEEIYIFYTSDVHCGIKEEMSFAKLKALVDDTRAAHRNVALVDLGDYIQGGTYGTLTQGSLIIDLMNEMNYDLVTFGNHEFDYGMERLSELIAMAGFKTVATNVRYTGSGRSVFADIPEYVIMDFGGRKVAFIGVLTPASITDSTPAFFMEDGQFVYDFYSGDDGNNLYQKVQQTVNVVRVLGADYVVALSHLGYSEGYRPYDSVSLISHTTGIDVVLDGHAHAEIIGDLYPNAEGKDVILSSVGTKMQNVGELIIEPDGRISTVLISEYDREDEKIAEAVARADEQLSEILSQKVGEIPFDLTITDENGKRLIRNRETNLGDFVADALRDYMNTDIALFNGGGIRSTVRAGEVTYDDLLKVMPFNNTVSSSICTGQQILDCLEFTSRSTARLAVFEDNSVGENGGFLQVSGLKYTIDTSIESSVVTDDKGLFAGVAGQRRVCDVQVLKDGQYVPIDPQATYSVASIRYVLLEGGDGNTALADSQVLVDKGPMDLEVLIAWFEKCLGNYGQYELPQGRITVK
ncbi:MAG: bifunctional metallophosphatase/5'-nucleotidase [Erysipelotrichaceae bacterium]|nr:bifunctional metallophosphatase/5'-nucleotidase [Erysipelotrichaceae bacterium]